MSIVWKISNKLQQYHNTNYTGWGYPPAKCITQPKYNIQASSEILGNLRNYSENIVFLTNQVFSKNLLVIFLLTVCTPLTRGNLKHKSCEALISKILGSYSNYDVVSLFHSSLWILANPQTTVKPWEAPTQPDMRPTDSWIEPDSTKVLFQAAWPELQSSASDCTGSCCASQQFD